MGTFTKTSTAWVAIDFDELETPFDPNSTDAVEWAIKNHLPTEFHDVSYVLQHSSSACIVNSSTQLTAKRGTNIHLFFYLDRGLDYSPELKHGCRVVNTGWMGKFSSKFSRYMFIHIRF